jgi:hypothetical protein
MGCWRWEGTAEVVQTQPDLTYELRATLTYGRVDPSAGASIGAMPVGYRVLEGGMRYREQGSTESCRASGAGSATVDPETSPMSSFSHLLAGPFHRRAIVLRSPPDAFTVDIDCGLAGRSTRSHQGTAGPASPVEASPDGQRIEGETQLDEHTTVRWRLEAQRE